SRPCRGRPVAGGNDCPLIPSPTQGFPDRQSKSVDDLPARTGDQASDHSRGLPILEELDVAVREQHVHPAWVEGIQLTRPEEEMMSEPDSPPPGAFGPIYVLTRLG